MTTAFAQLQVAVRDLLAQAPAIAQKVHRQKTAPEPKERGSAINVRLMSSKCSASAIGWRDWDTVIGVECLYRAASADEVALDGVDPIAEAVFARLAAPGAAAALGTGVMDCVVDPEFTWEEEEGTTPLASATLVLRVMHRTEGESLAPRI